MNLYIWSKTVLVQQNTHKEVHMGPKACFTNKLKLCFSIYVALCILRIFKLGSFSNLCLIFTLSCTAVICVLSDLRVGKTFLQVIHFIWSLSIWFSSELFYVNFLLRLSHLYDILPDTNTLLTIWNFSSWFCRVFLFLIPSTNVKF